MFVALRRDLSGPGPGRDAPHDEWWARPGDQPRARSLTAPRSRLIRAGVGARSSGSGLRAAPMERLATSVRGPRLRDREFCVWSFAIRMLRMLAGDDCAAFTRIGRCDSRVDHSGRPPIVARVTPYAAATHPHRPDAHRRIRCPLRPRPGRPRRPDNHARDLCACDSTSRPQRAGGSQAVIQDVGKDPKRPQPWYARRNGDPLETRRVPGNSAVGGTGLEPVTSCL